VSAAGYHALDADRRGFPLHVAEISAVEQPLPQHFVTQRRGTPFAIWASAGALASTIRKIAVSTDFSEASDRAVGYAAALARGLGVALYIVHVLRDNSHYQDARATLGQRG
jgi:hypothetical protein